MSNPITLRPKSECKWDLVSLGEVMLRLDPGDLRQSHAARRQAARGTLGRAPNRRSRR